MEYIMQPQIYVDEHARKHHSKQLTTFAWAYLKRLQPAFEKIGDEATAAAEKYWEAKMSQYLPDGSIDPSDVAQSATEKGIETFETLSLAKYTLSAAWHATLYELFEQQLRLFLYKELEHYYEIRFGSFCTKLDQIRDLLSKFGFDVTTVTSWAKIEEMRLLCNVIKHGEGRSAQDLRKANPNLFRKLESDDLLSFYRTTLLEESLNIGPETIKEYVSATLAFWKEIPETNYQEESLE
jgi:hypothetical protein